MNNTLIKELIEYGVNAIDNKGDTFRLRKSDDFQTEGAPATVPLILDELNTLDSKELAALLYAMLEILLVMGIEVKPIRQNGNLIKAVDMATMLSDILFRDCNPAMLTIHSYYEPEFSAEHVRATGLVPYRDMLLERDEPSRELLDKLVDAVPALKETVEKILNKTRMVDKSELN